MTNYTPQVGHMVQGTFGAAMICAVYLEPDEQQRPIVQLAYLDGRRTSTTETVIGPFLTQWKCYERS